MPPTKVFFGVSLELAGKVISLEPKNAISEIKTKGIEVELPPGERVYLGTVGSSLNSIMTTLGVDDKIDSFLDPTTGALKKEALPDIQALQDAVGTVVEAGLYIDEFHVRIPGSSASVNSKITKDKTAYTVGLSAEWQEDSGDLIQGLQLKLRGVYFKISNE